MTGRRRAVLEVVLAVAAVVGCVASWLRAQSTVVIPPIADGEPTTTSVVYYPPLLVLAFMLGTLACVLLVVGVARWRRSSIAPKPNSRSSSGTNHSPAFTFGEPPT